MINLNSSFHRTNYPLYPNPNNQAYPLPSRQQLPLEYQLVQDLINYSIGNLPHITFLDLSLPSNWKECLDAIASYAGKTSVHNPDAASVVLWQFLLLIQEELPSDFIDEVLQLLDKIPPATIPFLQLASTILKENPASFPLIKDMLVVWTLYATHCYPSKHNEIVPQLSPLADDFCLHVLFSSYGHCLRFPCDIEQSLERLYFYLCDFPLHGALLEKSFFALHEYLFDYSSPIGETSPFFEYYPKWSRIRQFIEDKMKSPHKLFAPLLWAMTSVHALYPNVVATNPSHVAARVIDALSLSYRREIKIYLLQKMKGCTGNVIPSEVFDALTIYTAREQGTASGFTRCLLESLLNYKQKKAQWTAPGVLSLPQLSTSRVHASAYDLFLKVNEHGHEFLLGDYRSYGSTLAAALIAEQQLGACLDLLNGLYDKEALAIGDPLSSSWEDFPYLQPLQALFSTLINMPYSREAEKLLTRYASLLQKIIGNFADANKNKAFDAHLHEILSKLLELSEPDQCVLQKPGIAADIFLTACTNNFPKVKEDAARFGKAIFFSMLADSSQTPLFTAGFFMFLTEHNLLHKDLGYEPVLDLGNQLIACQKPEACFALPCCLSYILETFFSEVLPPNVLSFCHQAFNKLAAKKRSHETTYFPFMEACEELLDMRTKDSIKALVYLLARQELSIAVKDSPQTFLSFTFKALESGRLNKNMTKALLISLFDTAAGHLLNSKELLACYLTQATQLCQSLPSSDPRFFNFLKRAYPQLIENGRRVGLIEEANHFLHILFSFFSPKDGDESLLNFFMNSTHDLPYTFTLLQNAQKSKDIALQKAFLARWLASESTVSKKQQVMEQFGDILFSCSSHAYTLDALDKLLDIFLSTTERKEKKAADLLASQLLKTLQAKKKKPHNTKRYEKMLELFGQLTKPTFESLGQSFLALLVEANLPELALQMLEQGVKNSVAPSFLDKHFLKIVSLLIARKTKKQTTHLKQLCEVSSKLSYGSFSADKLLTLITQFVAIGSADAYVIACSLICPLADKMPHQKGKKMIKERLIFLLDHAVDLTRLKALKLVLSKRLAFFDSCHPATQWEIIEKTMNLCLSDQASPIECHVEVLRDFCQLMSKKSITLNDKETKEFFLLAVSMNNRILQKGGDIESFKKFHEDLVSVLTPYLNRSTPTQIPLGVHPLSDAACLYLTTASENGKDKEKETEALTAASQKLLRKLIEKKPLRWISCLEPALKLLFQLPFSLNEHIEQENCTLANNFLQELFHLGNFSNEQSIVEKLTIFLSTFAKQRLQDCKHSPSLSSNYSFLGFHTTIFHGRCFQLSDKQMKASFNKMLLAIPSENTKRFKEHIKWANVAIELLKDKYPHLSAFWNKKQESFKKIDKNFSQGHEVVYQSVEQLNQVVLQNQAPEEARKLLLKLIDPKNIIELSRMGCSCADLENLIQRLFSTVRNHVETSLASENKPNKSLSTLTASFMEFLQTAHEHKLFQDNLMTFVDMVEKLAPFFFSLKSVDSCAIALELISSLLPHPQLNEEQKEKVSVLASSLRNAVPLSNLQATLSLQKK